MKINFQNENTFVCGNTKKKKTTCMHQNISRLPVISINIHYCFDSGCQMININRNSIGKIGDPKKQS